MTAEGRATLLIVDDEEKLRRFLSREFERKGYPVRVAAGRDAALAELSDGKVDVVLLDIMMPSTDGMTLLEELRREHPELAVIMLTGNASVDTAVRALKLGARDYLSKPYDMGELQLAVDRAWEESCLLRENESLRLEFGVPQSTPDFVGTSPAVSALRQRLQLLGKADSPVLLLGGDGSGKELAARALHAMAPRPRGAFLVLDCAEFEPEALEARLLGLDARKGLIELAARGSLLLADADALPPTVQAQLLRALESGEFRRLGSATPRRLRVRLFFSSAADLEQAVRQRRFNRDLLSRLSACEVRIPALRDRTEDIPALAEAYLRSRAPATTLSTQAAALLARYPWPGNVRQLQGVLERARVKAQGSEIAPSDIFLPRTGDGPFEAPESLAAVERSHILKTLADCQGNRTRAASLLGVDPKTLYNKLKEYRGRE